MSIDLSTRVRPSDEVLFRELDSEAVLLDLKSETYFGLDDVGTAMWQAAIAAPSLADAVPVLLDGFDAPEATVTGDLLAFAEELVMRGLLTVQ